MAKNKHSLSDELWETIQPWIPPRDNPHPRKGGRKPKDDRTVFTAILFVLRTGCQWNALNDTGICASTTAFDRFQKWAQAGLFHRLWEEGLLEYDATEGIDWSWLSMDGTMTKTPLGGEKKRAQSNRPWQARRQKELAVRYKRNPSGAGN